MVQDVGVTEMAPEIRVGDRERRDVDALLQEAASWR
jgi:hypothetical protein